MYICWETIIVYIAVRIEYIYRNIWGSILKLQHRTDRVRSRHQFPVEPLDTAVDAGFVCQLHKAVSCWTSAHKDRERTAYTGALASTPPVTCRLRLTGRSVTTCRASLNLPATVHQSFGCVAWAAQYILPSYPVSYDLDSKRGFSHGTEGLLDEGLVHVRVQLNTQVKLYMHHHVHVEPTTDLC